MRTHTRAGSKVRVHVDGDWGGTAEISIERNPANKGIVEYRNAMPALLAIAKAAVDRQAAIDMGRPWPQTLELCEKRLLEAVRKVKP